MFDRFIFDSGKFDRETNDSYEGHIHGSGELVTTPEMIQELSITFDGSASFSAVLAAVAYITGNNGEIIDGNLPPDEYEGLKLVLVMEMNIALSGTGDLDMFNIGDIQTEIINLRGLSLLPNKTITIDTDSMTVLFGLEHDVSSLSNDSVFFNLNEGTNEIKFIIDYESVPSPMPANELETTIIWQNRWL